MPSEIAGIDAATGGKEAEISKLTVQSGRYEIVLSNPKATCLIFAILIYSINPVLGGTTKRTARYVCHPPTFVGG